MTFGADHYVPILKLKQGEKQALGAIAPTIRQRTTPLLEVVELASNKSLPQHLATSFKGLAQGVHGFARFFLDTREISPAGGAGAAAAFEAAAAIGTAPFTPVTGLSRTADVAAAMAHRKNGVAVRLSRDEFESGQIPRSLPPWLAAHGLTPEHVDLIVDLGAVDDMVVAGVVALTTAFLADVPDHTRWRTLTVSACAFPMSMGVVDRHSHDFVDRIEWQAWRDALHAVRSSLPRVPSFSDGAIQHPRGVEGFDFTIMQISASARYTLADRWLLIKGESTRNVPPGTQFPSLATQLVYGHLAPHFAGAKHCAGCKGIHEAANGAPRFGSAGVWRRLGTIHHITRAVEELVQLPWP
jgi:hypothetical protein